MSMNVSLRESRLILERLVQAAGVPAGLLPTVRDAALYSAALPGPGFADMEGRIAVLRDSAPAPLVPDEQGVVDGAGQHSWYAVAGLLDLAIDKYLRTGRGEVLVSNIAAPDELRVVAGLAEAYGLAATVTASDAGSLVRVNARPAALPTLLDQIRGKGIPVEPALWWRLYHASHEALAPDSFESRRHAGTVRVEADGRVVGRGDEDETDLSMLVADPARLRLTSAS